MHELMICTVKEARPTVEPTINHACCIVAIIRRLKGFVNKAKNIAVSLSQSAASGRLGWRRCHFQISPLAMRAISGTYQSHPCTNSRQWPYWAHAAPAISPAPLD